MTANEADIKKFVYQNGAVLTAIKDHRNHGLLLRIDASCETLAIIIPQEIKEEFVAWLRPKG